MVLDPLTGVYTRATLEQRLHEEIERAQRYSIPFSMILVDLDHYKSVNDAFGHARGDRVLTEFAQRLTRLTRKSDVIFRYGGDEFLLLLPNTHKSQAVTLAQRLLDGIKNQPFRGKPPISLTASLGVATYKEDGYTPEAMFEKADMRHYEAKRRGRNRLVAEDFTRQPLLPFDEDSRLIERDEAITAVHRFLKDLQVKHRGILAIVGPVGSGKSRFLSEVNKVSRLQGYEVVSFHGSPALKNRAYGELAEVCKNWETLPPPYVGQEEFGKALQRLVVEKGRSGLIFTVDNLPEVDWPSLEMLRHLVLTDYLPIKIGMAFSTENGSLRKLFPLLPQLNETIYLGSISRPSFQIWLRTILHWEAPVDFADWLYAQTGGMPSFLQKALTELMARGYLEKSGDGWAFNREYLTLSLKENLDLPVSLPPHNLPSTPTSFIGREFEIGEARKQLSQGRILTLIGTGGVGKTRLALQIAAEMLEKFSSGVCWVPLASVGAPDLLVSAIADALHFSFYSREEPEVQLSNFLREKDLLLVLDNFEHLIRGAELFSRLLENSPKLKILVTSRERLNLHGETVMEIRGMQYPTPGAKEPLESYPAIQFFVQCARRSEPGFFLNDEIRDPVVQICRTLEGLPLGIELAAAWVRVLSCQEIAQEIAGNLDFLTSPLRDIPERHRSLRAVFEHSWNLLLEDERCILRRVAVFEGSFSRDAASQVTGASLAHLITLIDKTLLRKTTTSRYEMHEVLRQYAIEKLNESAEETAATYLRHSEHYTDLLAKKLPLLLGEKQKEGLEAIGEELENIRAAWRYAIERRRLDLIEKSQASLYHFYEIRGLFAEGELVFRKALEGVQDLSIAGQLQANHALIEAGLEARCGMFCYHLSAYEPARRQLENSLRVFRHHSYLPDLAFALYGLAHLIGELGEFDRARSIDQEAMSIFDALGDYRGIAWVLNDLGNMAYTQGKYLESEHHHRESLRIFREINDRWGLARSLISLGNVGSELGEYYQSQQYYMEGRLLCEELGATVGLAATLNNLGDIAREIGAFDEAIEYLRQGLELYTQIGDRWGMSVSLGNLGDVAFRMGEFDLAKKYLNRSLGISLETGNKIEVAYILAHLGNVASAQEDYPAAKDFFLEGLQIAVSRQVVPLQMQILLGIAQMLKRLGRLAEALMLVNYVLQEPATMKDPRDEAEKLHSSLSQQLSPVEVLCASENCRAFQMDEYLKTFSEMGFLKT